MLLVDLMMTMKNEDDVDEIDVNNCAAHVNDKYLYDADVDDCDVNDNE